MASASIIDPQTYNRYIYVSNNPLNFNDPTGMTAQSANKGNECPEGKVCDENGKVIETDKDGTLLVGSIAVITSLPSNVETVTTETIKVAKDTIIEPNWWEMFWHNVKKTPGIVGRNAGKGLSILSRGVSVIGIILTNPTTTGCGASPGMKSDGNGGCVYDPNLDLRRNAPDVDTSANPDPQDNNPNTDVSISPTLSKKQNERPDTGFADLPDAEISKRARDRSLPGPERRKYQKEEKIRGKRNKQKRDNK